MTTALPPTAAAYVRSINDRDADAFIALFADTAFVNDAGREFRGLAAIKAWSEREIFAPLVTLEVIGVADQGLETVLTTRVDGNFDRTGLPDPVIIDHSIKAAGDRIVGLTCRLAGERPSGVLKLLSPGSARLNTVRALFRTGCLLIATASLVAQVRAADGETFYVNPETGADTNPGTEERPLKTLPIAADRVNDLKGEGAVTIVLSPGNYALDRQISLKANRKYTKVDRLTIRAEVLPDDAKWDTGKMPTLIHTMPLARRGFTFGMHVETSHVTIQ